MYNFLFYGVPVIILIAAIGISFCIPCTTIQVIAAPLLGGIPMWLLSNFIHVPNVIIEELGNEVSFQLLRNEITCSIPGVMVNRSSTGSGELKELVLRIYLSKECLDVPIEVANDVASNYRFLPYGRYPSQHLWFKKYPVSITNQEIIGKQAEIRLSIIGQPNKIYKVEMAK